MIIIRILFFLQIKQTICIDCVIGELLAALFLKITSYKEQCYYFANPFRYLYIKMSAPLSNVDQPDPKVINSIVDRLKKQGLFDQFRKECLADIDTKVCKHKKRKVKTCLKSKPQGANKKYLLLKLLPCNFNSCSIDSWNRDFNQTSLLLETWLTPHRHSHRHSHRQSQSQSQTQTDTHCQSHQPHHHSSVIDIVIGIAIAIGIGIGSQSRVCVPVAG